MRFLLTIMTVLSMATPALADHHEAEKTMPMPEMGRPAEMDQVAFMEGDWTVDVQYRMDPAGEWMTNQATSSCKSILNGCAQTMTFEGEMMGMPYNGLNITTYNRETDRFESVWLDDMGARMSLMHGGFEDGKLVMEGEDLWQGQTFHNRGVSEKVSDDEVRWDFHMSMDGGENWIEMMKMTYVRKK